MLLYIDDPARFVDELWEAISHAIYRNDLRGPTDAAVEVMKQYQRADNQTFVPRKEDWSGCCC